MRLLRAATGAGLDGAQPIATHSEGRAAPLAQSQNENVRAPPHGAEGRDGRVTCSGQPIAASPRESARPKHLWKPPQPTAKRARAERRAAANRKAPLVRPRPCTCGAGPAPKLAAAPRGAAPGGGPGPYKAAGPSPLPLLLLPLLPPPRCCGSCCSCRSSARPGPSPRRSAAGGAPRRPSAPT